MSGSKLVVNNSRLLNITVTEVQEWGTATRMAQHVLACPYHCRLWASVVVTMTVTVGIHSCPALSPQSGDIPPVESNTWWRQHGWRRSEWRAMGGSVAAWVEAAKVDTGGGDGGGGRGK